MRKRVILGISIGGIAVVLALVGGFIMGSRFQGGGAGGVAQSTGSVCDDTVITQYNAIAEKVPSNEAEYAKVQEQLVEKSKEVAALPDMKNDPTCLYIAVNGELTGGKNVDIVNSYISRLEALADKQVFANTNLRGITSIPNLKAAANGLKSANQASGDGGAKQ